MLYNCYLVTTVSCRLDSISTSDFVYCYLISLNTKFAILIVSKLLFYSKITICTHLNDRILHHSLKINHTSLPAIKYLSTLKLNVWWKIFYRINFFLLHIFTLPHILPFAINFLLQFWWMRRDSVDFKQSTF